MTPSDAPDLPRHVTEFAPAKLNLCLHVTGRRDDGYHLLQSLVIFADTGDHVTARPADAMTLTMSGRFAADVTAGADNLVLRAATLMGAPCALHLQKNLPVASGIGGGSADAAATLRAVGRLTGQPLPSETDILALGADLPVCLNGRPVLMEGVGERLTVLPALPDMPLVLVNPGLPLATATVFRALTSPDNPAMPAVPDGVADLDALCDWLALTRNDLEAPARQLQPVIATVRSALDRQPGVRLSRMSGSGATCFAIFADEAAATVAQAAIADEHPDWWVVATRARRVALS